MNKLILSASLALTSLFFSFGLNAQITSFPHTEDFDSWSTCGTTCATTCALQSGWVNAASANRDWLVDAGGTGSTNTGPSADHTTGNSTGNYLYAETSSPCFSGSNSWHLELPAIDLTGTNDIQVNFWYHAYGSSMGTAHVDVSTDGGTTWTLDIVPSWTDNQDLWQEKTVSLGGFSGIATVRIRFEDPTDFYADFAIDDFTIFDLLPNDAGVTAIVNPSLPTCAFNDTVTVTLTNFGTAALTNVILNWSLNGVTQTPATFWTGSLASGQSIDVFVGAAPYTSGDDLKAWTSNPNGVIEVPSGAGNDTTSIQGLLTGFNGVYTVGGTTPDFSDISTALAALNFAGVCGPTTFEIRTGTYTDQFILGQVTGMDATNTVTFKSETGNRADVIFDYTPAAAADNFVVQLDDADYYRFESMTLRNSGTTYGTVVNITNGSDYNVFSDCELNTVSSSNTTSTNIAVINDGNTIDEFNKFEGNSIIGGSYGAYVYGSGTTSLQQGTEFINNEFENNYYAGIWLYYSKDAVVTGNRVFGNSSYTSRYGIRSYYGDGAAVFTHNSVEANASSTFYYGMYIAYCDATNAGRGLIANNSVSSGSLGSTGTSYALYFSYSGFYDIYNNSFDVIGGGTSSRAMYITNGGANNVKNNSFTNYGDGYAAYVVGTYAINEMDYNNFYSNGANLGYFDASALTTFVDWQSTTGYDANGLNVDPGFYSEYDLHVCSDSLNGKGSILALITDDRDGQLRDTSTPDIGSDEFAPLGVPGFLGPDALVCSGQTVTIYAGASTDIVAWSTGDTTTALVVSTPGTYTVTVTGACGTSFDTITVLNSALSYTGYLMADTMQFCSGGSAILTSNMSASNYSWTGGSTNDTLVVTSGGTYTLNISDACGTGSESVVINELTTPVASFTQLNSFMTVGLTSTSTVSGNTSYAWDFGDGNTSTMMNPSHVYSTLGTFTVTLTVTNECGTNSTTQTVVSSNLGLEDILANGNISLFPNPSKGEFTIGMDIISNSAIDIRIENILGAVVYESNLGQIEGQHKEVVNLKNAEAGVYFVSITAGDHKIMKKIVIE